MDEQPSFDYSSTPFPPPAPEIYPPWEDSHQPIAERWLATVKSVFLTPITFFSRMNITRDIEAPFAFGMIGGTIGSVAASLYSMIQGFGQLFRFDAPPFNQPPFNELSRPTLRIAFGSGSGCGIFLAPLSVLIGLFFFSGVYHLSLLLIGGARKDFKATFRVVAYSIGALALLRIVPFCGNAVCGIWLLVMYVIGFSRAHGISSGRAVVAVLLPTVAFCLCLMGFFVSIFGLNLAVFLQR